MRNPLVSVICPVYNSEKYIELTIKSVVNQSYSNFEFIIVDGGSNDQTLSIVDSYKDSISTILSEPDSGMYDALVKGFRIASGEIVCYINAGDLLNSFALEAVVAIFENERISWVTGCRSVCSEGNVVTHVDLPFRYKNSLIQSGSYGTTLPFIQQESTFWRRSLLDAVDLGVLRQFKYAGDYFLWWSFSHVAELQVVSCPFGIFKKHQGQLSEDIKRYSSEIKSFVEIRKINHKVSEFVELIFWALHPKIRAFFVKSVLRFDHAKQEWCFF